MKITPEQIERFDLIYHEAGNELRDATMELRVEGAYVRYVDFLSALTEAREENERLTKERNQALDQCAELHAIASRLANPLVEKGSE